MNPTNLSASLRQMRGKAEQSGWDDAARTMHGADDSYQAADSALALLNDLLDEAAHFHTSHDG